MKNKIKIAFTVLAMSCAFCACKGGVSGEKQDSTMVDTNATDSIGAKNKAAGTMGNDSLGKPTPGSGESNGTKK